MFDLVIRNGTVIDGTGSPARVADVGVLDGIVVEVGDDIGVGHREIDADGHLVTPGFVDVHTHYDGQATWDDAMAPSSWHGVTTVVMGNCGVGFAPVLPENRERLVQLMEGVEDIPGAALDEGLTWEWESFGRVLGSPRTPPPRHRRRSAAAARRSPTPRDGRAWRSGRTGHSGRHRRDGGHRPSGDPRRALWVSRPLARSITAPAWASTRRRSRQNATNSSASPRVSVRPVPGCSRWSSDFVDLEHEFETFRLMAERSGRPISVSVAQGKNRPDDWKTLLDGFAESTTTGVVMRGQVGRVLSGSCSDSRPRSIPS